MEKEKMIQRLDDIKQALGIYPSDEAYCRNRNKAYFKVFSFFMSGYKDFIIKYLISIISKPHRNSPKTWYFNLFLVTYLEDNFTNIFENKSQYQRSLKE